MFLNRRAGGRTARNVNPIAWDRGFVMGQCAQCEVSRQRGGIVLHLAFMCKYHISHLYTTPRTMNTMLCNECELLLCLQGVGMQHHEIYLSAYHSVVTLICVLQVT